MPVLKNAKHEKFAQELAKGTNAGDALALAGYAPNPKNADRLKKNEGIQARVEELVARAADRAEVKIADVIEELRRVAFADITDAIGWGTKDVTLKASDNLPKEITAAIAEVTQTKDGIRIKFHDKLGAIEKLGRQLGMFKAHVEHSGTITLEQLVVASRKIEGDK